MVGSVRESTSHRDWRRNGAAAPRVLINPPASILGDTNAILRGRATDYHVHEFPGPLSIKSVIRGSAEWRVGRNRFEVDRDSYLILNHDQPYSLTIEARKPVETFCVFFKHGFVEDAFDAATAPRLRLLDDPCPPPVQSIGFFESLHPPSGSVPAILNELRAAAAPPDPHIESLDALIYLLAIELIDVRSDVAARSARLPLTRRSTRDEITRRLLAGKRAIEQSVDGPLRLDQIAREACLSPFHFHRQFRAYFGETPHSFALRLRMAKAARLLEESDRPVAAIGFECGFESPGTFGTAFRKHFGVAPGRFRLSKKARSK